MANEEKTKSKTSPSVATTTAQKNKIETPVYSEYQGSSPSLKNLSVKKPEDIQNDGRELKPLDAYQPKEIFSNDELKTSWLRYAEEIKTKLPRMFLVLQSHIATKASDNQIIVTFDSESQRKDFMEKVQLGLMGFLKNELNNFAIELTTDIIEEVESKNLIYTVSDKYKYLAEQNPMLETFKKKFNLDFE